MHITVLGTRGEVAESAPFHSRHSGILIDETLLFDLGEREFLDERPDHIFITHLHPDHAFFVTGPASFDIPVSGPEAYDDAVTVTVIDGPAYLGPYTITPVPTHHSKLVKSAAYLVRKGGESLLYTGDLIWINREYHTLFDPVDLVITDGSLIRKGGRIRRDPETGVLYGHNGIPDLVRLFAPYTTRILFVHFGSWFYEDIEAAREKIAALGEEYGVSVSAAHDGMELETAGPVFPLGQSSLSRFGG
jgi:glyoxylase-like metal-dependent hydrolase (beta-lactamase superfamily II)